MYEQQRKTLNSRYSLSVFTEFRTLPYLLFNTFLIASHLFSSFFEFSDALVLYGVVRSQSRLPSVVILGLSFLICEVNRTEDESLYEISGGVL